MSITAITAADIEQRGLVGAGDYLRGLPGVNQVEDQRGQAIVIRGIESNPQLQNFYSGATVATYFGETPTTWWQWPHPVRARGSGTAPVSS